MREREDKVGICGYAALVFAVVFFSGVFSKSSTWTSALDFQTYVGSFGKICNDAFGTGFVGSGGTGVKEGFMQALSIAPVMIFSVAFISCIEYLGGLKAAQKLLTPVLKFVMGIPGICGIAMILNWQSSDASAAQARDLYENGKITRKERERLVAYEFITAATIGVFFSNGAVVLPYLTCATGVMLLVIIVNKFVAANIIRLYQTVFEKNVPDTYANGEAAKNGK